MVVTVLMLVLAAQDSPPAAPRPPAVVMEAVPVDGRAPDAVPNRPLYPINEPRRWVRERDYPVAAREEKRTGKTVVRLKVNRWGRVGDCSIIASSGHADLDATVCEKAVERARFYPALSQDMQPTDGYWEYPVVWKEPQPMEAKPTGLPAPPGWGASLPSPPQFYFPTRRRADIDEYPAAALAAGEEGRTRVKLTIDAEGVVRDCKVNETSGSVSLDKASCAYASEFTASKPAQDIDGNPTTGVVERGVTWVIRKNEAEVAIPSPAPRPASQPRNPRPFPFTEDSKSGFIITVNSDGTIRDCTAISEGSQLQSRGSQDVCKRGISEERVEPFRNEKGEAEAKTITFVMQVDVEDAEELEAE